MGGNQTAGILLLLGGAALLSVGMTDKGKQILAILLNKQVEYKEGDYKKDAVKEPDGTIKRYSGDTAPSGSMAKYPGAFVGERGAGPT